jgi:hypothetical protein
MSEAEGDVRLVVLAGVGGDEVFDPLYGFRVDLFFGGTDEGLSGASAYGVGLDGIDDSTCELRQLGVRSMFRRRIPVSPQVLVV